MADEGLCKFVPTINLTAPFIKFVNYVIKDQNTNILYYEYPNSLNACEKKLSYISLKG